MERITLVQKQITIAKNSGNTLCLHQCPSSRRGLYECPFPIEDGNIIIPPGEPGFVLVPSKAVRDALG
jgi:hypothetical protein